MDASIVRVLVDGVFDCTHFGHANSLRRARLFGNQVVAGIHPDSEVLKHKACLPVFTESERYELVENLRFCDDNVKGLRYDYDLADLDKHKLHFNAHGDEVVYSGSGAVLYGDIKAAGRYRIFPRTEGTCTTDVIDAVLNSHKDEQTGRESKYRYPKISLSVDAWFDNFLDLLNVYHSWFRESFAPSTLYSLPASFRDPPIGPIVYVQGDFDVFNIGHLKFLQQAKQFGASLIVGLNPDDAIQEAKGIGFPTLNALQRALNVLSYSCVDGVIIRTKCEMDESFLQHLNASVVCHGIRTKPPADTSTLERLGILRTVDSGSSVTSQTIIERILAKRDAYESRNAKKYLQMHPPTQG